MTIKSTVIIVNYGSSDLLAHNLQERHPEEIEVVIVDNYTTDLEQQTVVELGRRNGWRVVTSPTNSGFGAACNLGAAASESETLAFVNPDVEFSWSAILDLSEEAAAVSDRCISATILDSRGSPWFEGASLDLSTGRTSSTNAFASPSQPWLTGACLVMSRELWERVGGFDDDYFLYWEDIDLSSRVLATGGQLAVVDVQVVHAVGGTQGRGKSAIYMYYNCRNRLLFAAKNLPRRVRLRWLVGTPLVSWRILRRTSPRQLLAQPSLVWSALRGSAAGSWLVLRSLGIGQSAAATSGQTPRDA